MKLLALLAALMICSLTLCTAQPPDTLWTRTYGGANEDWATIARPLVDGNLIIGGTSRSFGLGTLDAYLVKTDCSGNLLWQRHFGMDDRDETITDVVQAANGDLLLTGHTECLYDCAFLARISAEGDSIWWITFPDFSFDPLNLDGPTSTPVIIEHPNGNITSVGYKGFTWMTNERPRAYSLTVTATGETIQVWQDWGYVGMYTDLARLTDGTIWAARNFNALAQPPYYYDLYVVLDEISPGGNQIAVSDTFDYGIRTQYLNWVDWQMSYRAGGGALLNSWQRLVMYDGDMRVNSTDVSIQHSAGLVGTSDSALIMLETHPLYTELIKFSLDGSVVWQREFAVGYPEHRFESIDTVGNGFLLAGYTGTWHYRDDIYVIRTTSDLSSRPNETLLAHVQSLTSYPNPFNPSTTIAFTIDKPEQVTLVVYDLNGREVATLIDGTVERGEHKLNFDGHALPSGLYFARMQTANGIAKTVKLALVK
jgi:hypothetical protein